LYLFIVIQQHQQRGANVEAQNRQEGSFADADSACC
jgi:hypothetical protein